MSKIGRKPIIFGEGVVVTVSDGVFVAQKGEKKVEVKILPGTSCEVKDKEIIISSSDASKQGKSNWGTMRALVNNAVLGVTKDFSKTLEIEGIGFKVAPEGKNLVLNLGFSHPITYTPPQGVEIKIDKNTMIISGSNKEIVGAVAAKIRSFKKPEPYKGKGIRYKGEVIRRKAGKKVGATTGSA